MKTVLCFGDSITRGLNPGNDNRYGRDVRYPGVLQKLLGSDYLVIEEGLDGRTCMLERINDPCRNAQYYIEPCLCAHKPVDMIIVMLGTNDSLLQFNLRSEEIGKGMEQLITMIKTITFDHQGYIPKIVLVAPPIISDNYLNSPYVDDLIGSREKMIDLIDIYRKIAQKDKLIYVNSNEFCETSKIDSVHLDAENQIAFAKNIAEIVKNNI